MKYSLKRINYQFNFFSFIVDILLCMLNIVKLHVSNKNDAPKMLNKVKSLKHFPSSIREWNNSIYVYNKNSLNLIPHSTISGINIIKSYFLLYNYKLERKIRTKRFSRRFRRLSLNKIYISNGEFKHTNNKVIINLYLFNRHKYNYMSTIRKLYLNTMFRIKNKGKFRHINKTSINMRKFTPKKANFNNLDLKKSKLNIYEIRNIKVKKYKLKHNKSKKIKLENIKLHNYKPPKKKSSVRYFKYKLKMLKFRNRLWNIKFKDFKVTKSLYIYKSYFKCKLLNLSLDNYKNIKLSVFKLYNKIFIKLTNNNFNLKFVKISKLNNKKFKCKLKIKIIKSTTDKKINKYKLERKANKKVKNLKPKIKKIINKNEIIKYKSKGKVKKFIKKKGLLLLRLINKEKHLIVNNLKQDTDKRIYFFISAFTTKFYKNFIKKALRKLKLYFYYRQLLYINKNKYNYTYLQYLNKYLYSLYNKNIEYNLINLKRFYLHSDILSEYITLKLTKNRKRLLKKLKKLETKLEKKIEISQAFLSKKESITKKNHKKLNYKYLAILPTKSKKRKIINNIKHKYITGFRLETKGRLTRRYKASKSVSKNVYVGNLLHLNTKYLRSSSVLLKGNLRSNLQYTKLKSKSPIGSFGIKGWISGN